MDSALSTAARALSVGNPLEALNHVALRSDAAALALRGIAMAQLGELDQARKLLSRAATAFGTAQPVAQARCVVAKAEVALAARDVRGAARGLDAAAKLLERRGDRENALFARLVGVRRSILLGDVDRAERELGRLKAQDVPARLRAIEALLRVDIALKRVSAESALVSLEIARRAATEAGIAPLLGEVQRVAVRLQAPVARLVAATSERALSLAEVERLFDSGELVIDAGRREVKAAARSISLQSRPVLLALAVGLARRAPAEAPRDALIAEAFEARRVNESHRARLRVEIGRLRKLLKAVADVTATPNGFVLLPRAGRRVALLLPPGAGEVSELLALLGGGEAWSTSALAAALGKSQRSVQRALSTLEADGKVRSTGAGQARRWVVTPAAGFATALLLVARGSLG